MIFSPDTSRAGTAQTGTAKGSKRVLGRRALAALIVGLTLLSASPASAQIFVDPAPGTTASLCATAPDGELAFGTIVLGTCTLTGSSPLNLTVDGSTMLNTLSTSGAAMLDSLGVTNNATVGGTLEVTGVTTTNGIDNGGDGITNAGAISGVTDLTGDGTGNVSGFVDVTASGTVEGATLTDGAGTTITGGTVTTTTVAATTGNITTVNATTGNVTTLNSTTIVNSGSTSTNSLSVGTGGVTVASGAPVSMGGNRVQNVATPVDPTDAANKAYVDSMSGNVTNLEAAINAQSARVDKAFTEIDKNREGIAIAMAMGGLVLPQGKAFAIGANMGFFQDKQAAAAQTLIRLNETLTFNGGVGVGLGGNQLGGRAGLMAAW